MLLLLVSGLVVVAATGLYTWLVWVADRHEKEPWSLILAALVWGAIPAVLLALVAELWADSVLLFPLFGEGVWKDLVEGGLAAPVAEELAKALMLWLLLRYRRLEFDGPVDGLVYGAVVGFGFAMTENFLYFAAALEEGVLAWVVTVFLRQVVFGLNHAFYTALSGAGFSMARLSSGPGRRVWPWVGLAAATFFHSWHNVMALLTGVELLALVGLLFGTAGGLAVVGAIFLLALARERRWVATELAEEVGRLLTPEEYAWICAHRPWDLGPRGRDRRWRRFYRLAVELALKKRQQRAGDQDTATALRAAQLRAELVSLKEALNADAGRQRAAPAPESPAEGSRLPRG